MMGGQKKGVNLLEGLEGVDVGVQILDLGSLQSVVAFAQRFMASGAKADVLINNAGIMAIPERRETVDGFESQIGVNHFGGHLLTRLMEPMISDGGRVVFLSSIAHNPRAGSKLTMEWDDLNCEKPGSYGSWTAYCRSKLANILDTKEFATRLASRGINTYAVHPGVVNTELMRNLTDGSSVVSRLAKLTSPLFKYVLASPLDGALTSLRCAVDPSLAAPEMSGKYWANMTETKPSAAALDPANPTRMWTVTEDILEAKLGKKVDELLSS
ncbi:unnamed protein product [Laminaria digitata]